MNRMEEYNRLMRELDDPVPGLEDTLKRAKAKMNRRRRILGPVTGAAAAFALFVLLVNFCSPVAYACSKVPFLKELAEAVTFSRSLSDAVENRYVQPIDLEQTDNGVTASVEYLIVDQKQVNVFYRLDSDVYEHMSETPRILNAEGAAPPPCAYGVNRWDVPNGELRSVTIDFIDEDVPGKLRFQLDIQDLGSWQSEDIIEDSPAPEMVPAENALLDQQEPEEPEYIAHFDFLLEFDPEFTTSGKIVTLNQPVDLDGQTLTLTTLEIYPTHLRVNVSDTPENTAWLERLDFYVETDWGMKFEPVANGITATGTANTPMMNSYRCDSSYFYKANHLKIVITGAEWLDKDMEKIHLDLKTGKIDRLPEGVTLDGVEQKENGWILRFRAEERKAAHSHQIMTSTYFDAEGNSCSIDSWEVTSGEDGTFCETIPLKNYPYEEVWLCPRYSREWISPEPVVIVAQ